MKKLTPNKKWLLWLLPLVIVLNVGFYERPDDNRWEIAKNMEIFIKLYEAVNENYVDDVDPGQFMRTGIDAMLQSLDPYTNYISASEIEDYRFMSTGQYGGIGATISKRDGIIQITEPYEDSPAIKAGLMAGDIIIAVDGETVQDEEMSTTDVRDLLRGQPNSTVKVTVNREGTTSPITVEVVRADIKIKNVPYHGMIDDKIGYISLTGFTSGAANEVKTAYQDLKKNHPALEGVILDLRGNPGGLLFEAIDISNLFVDQGEKIVETRGKIEGSLKTYTARSKPIDTEMPLAVLINRRSASASEIVSGVMQDLDRGVIVGQRSFGKGLVQTTRPLAFKSQIKITTAKYYTPSGRCIQAIDYSNRNEDGSVGRVPDSLKKEFKTRVGRSVWDGGGIEPDLDVELPEYHTVTQELIKQGIIFDFATRYAVSHDKIEDPRGFQITDALYTEFVNFCAEKNFTYETKTEKEFAKLAELMKEEAYYEELEGQLKDIQGQISKEKESDLQAFREEISGFLKTELVRRYHYRSGEIEASFDLDPDVLEAIAVLQDKDKYRKTLARQ